MPSPRQGQGTVHRQLNCMDNYRFHPQVNQTYRNLFNKLKFLSQTLMHETRFQLNEALP